MKKQVVLWIFLSLLFATAVMGYNGYRSPGGFWPYSADFGTTLNNILDWFTENPGWVDALALLVIFLVLGKRVFMKHFESRALYITIAVALTLGVLLWERQTGVSLILNSGPAGLFILLVAVFMFFFLMIRHATGMGFVAFAITYSIFYYYLMYIVNYPPTYIPDWFYNIIEYTAYNFGWLLQLILGIVFIGIIFYGAVHLFKLVLGKEKSGG